VLAMSRNKYGNRKTSVDGTMFDSAREARRWQELVLMSRAGVISHLRRQVPFELIPSQRDENGKCIERECRYIADFVYMENGKMVVEDVKSSATKTPEYKIKRKLMLKEFGIRVKEY